MTDDAGHHHGHSHATLDEYPIAVLVHLSGPCRGTTDRLAGEFLTIGSTDDADLHVVDSEPGHSPELMGGFVCRGMTYELVAEPGRGLWVNGVETSKTSLESEDLIELGAGGAMLRYRLYPPNSPAYKTVAEAFGDCVECARHSDAGLIGRAKTVAMGFPKELATQTSRMFRGAVIVALVGLVFSTTLLARRSARLEARLAEELTRVEGFSELLERSAEQTLSLTDFESLRADVENRLQATAGRIGELEAQSGNVARIVEAASGATLFVQGGFGFVEPSTGRPLKLMLDTRGQPVNDMSGRPALTLLGDGPVFELPYTGTGFVVRGPGGEQLILTNRHVAVPWEYDAAAKGILESGFRGSMIRLRVFVPGAGSSVAAELVGASDLADVAVLRAEELPIGLPALELAERIPNPGEEVVVLGYPLGIRALVARADVSFIAQLQAGGATGFWEVADELAGVDGIHPLASGGIVGQVTRRAVVYDAETTSGGSGGPVLDAAGKVIAINAAILPEFGGSNMGVPVAFAQELLDGLFRRP